MARLEINQGGRRLEKGIFLKGVNWYFQRVKRIVIPKIFSKIIMIKFWELKVKDTLTVWSRSKSLKKIINKIIVAVEIRKLINFLKLLKFDGNFNPGLKMDQFYIAKVKLKYD